MKRKEIGEYLYLYYRKRSASFVMNIFKSTITADRKDIHRARLDAKRIFAIFDILEIFNDSDYSWRKARKLYMPVYKQAGVIRETQVNYLLLDQLLVGREEAPALWEWLKRREQRAIRKLIFQVEAMKESSLQDVELKVQHICMDEGINNIRPKTTQYYKQKFALISKILRHEPDEAGIHKLRTILKMVSTIATLAFSLKPHHQLDRLVSALNQTEMMIGDWHDLVVLRKDIADFLQSENNMAENTEKERLRALDLQLTEKSKNLVNHFLPEVLKLIEMV
jgi:CHAD domain-containing protein